MLLKCIGDEFAEVEKLLEELGAYECEVIRMKELGDGELSMKKMLRLIPMTRMFIRHDDVLRGRKFKSVTVNRYINRYLNSINDFSGQLDVIMQYLAENKEDHYMMYIGKLKRYSDEISETLQKISFASEIINMASNETWESLPSNIENNSIENVIILSETQGASLSDISKDVSSLDVFLNNIRHLIKGATNNNFYLRKVETGSLEIAISCILGATQIVEFIFLYIKLYQKAAKRELKNQERKMELINKSLDSAKKILEIDPQNTEAEEIVQRCALNIIEFLENNPKGSINGEVYNIEIENLKIEEKKKEE